MGEIRGATKLVKSLKRLFSAAPEGTAALFLRRREAVALATTSISTVTDRRYRIAAETAATTALAFLVSDETPKAFGDDLGNPPRRASFAGHQLAHARRREIRGHFLKKIKISTTSPRCFRRKD